MNNAGTSNIVKKTELRHKKQKYTTQKNKKAEQHGPHQKLRVNSGVYEG